jgi:hypothetical protein
MRDLLVVGIVLVGSLYALRYPWFGIMLWTWVSLMNPHALAYGFARDFPVAAIVAIATLIGVLTTRERQNPFRAIASGLVAPVHGVDLLHLSVFVQCRGQHRDVLQGHEG